MLGKVSVAIFLHLFQDNPMLQCSVVPSTARMMLKKHSNFSSWYPQPLGLRLMCLSITDTVEKHFHWLLLKAEQSLEDRQRSALFPWGRSWGQIFYGRTVLSERARKHLRNLHSLIEEDVTPVFWSINLVTNSPHWPALRQYYWREMGFRHG